MSPAEGSQQPLGSEAAFALQHSSQLRPRKQPEGALGLRHARSGRSQVAAVNIPARQVDSPEAWKPSLQVGWQACPLASDRPQVPGRPCFGGLGKLHGNAKQDAAVSVPCKHNVGPDTEYPALQLYMQYCPCWSSAVQFPLPPKKGCALESHGLRG